MNNAQKERLVQTLEQGAASLRETGLPAEPAAKLERLAGQVDLPCVLAVIGRMKAGKSTFVNALLGEDVAKVGTTETTATINRFRYGNPSDPDRPVRCRWRGGRDEDVSRAFLDGLQGNDVEALRRADGIEYLEFLLPNPYLRDVTLVDTPGTLAVVQEHQNRTAEFLNLKNQLRDRHDQETQRIGSEADAIIYLVGPVSRSTDQAFLEEFSQATGGRSRALNAIGVMAKIDFQPAILERRSELAAKIAKQLETSLNTVLPVSAGILRASRQLLENGNRALICLMERLREIPPNRLQKLLDSDELYELEFADCPVSPKERCELRGDMPWTVFTTIARLAAHPALSADQIVLEMEELAGFGPLREVLDRHFFKRARFLHCYRTLNDARKLIDQVRYRYLPAFRKCDLDEKSRRDRFLAFIRAAQGDRSVAKELEEFVSLQCGTHERAGKVESAIKELGLNLARLFHEMEEHNADFESLELLQIHQDIFSSAEFEELRSLLGIYGVELEKRLPPGHVTTEYAAGRQEAWSETRLCARDPNKRKLAERAEARYGLILHELLTTKKGGASNR
jgi:Dynamin family